MRSLALFILLLSINMLQIVLPVRVKLTEGRLSVVSSRLLMFNRVAKVGSKTLFKLLRTLGRVNGFKVGISNRQEEVHIRVLTKIYITHNTPIVLDLPGSPLEPAADGRECAHIA